MPCEDYEDDALWLDGGQERVVPLACTVGTPGSGSEGAPGAGTEAGLRRLVASVRKVVHDTYENPRRLRLLLRPLRAGRTFGHNDS